MNKLWLIPFFVLIILPLSEGYIIKPVCTGSMEPIITCGDRLEVSKNNTYVVGDIVGYKKCEYSEEWRKSHNGIPMLMKKKVCEPRVVYIHEIINYEEGMFWISGTGDNIWFDIVKPEDVLFKITKVIR